MPHGGVTLDDTGLTVSGGGANIAGGAIIAGGVTVSNTGLTVSGGGAIITGGVTVSNTGLTVTTGGASITDTGTTANTLTLTNSAGSFNKAILSMVSTATTGFSVIDAKVGSTSVFNVAASGLTTISAGGLSVSGGTTMAGGVTVSNTGLTVSGGGASVTGGITAVDIGVTVTTGGARIYDTGSTAETLTVKNSANSLNKAILYLDSTATSGFPLIDAKVAGNSQFTVTAAGATTIASGGLSVTGGVTIADTGLAVSLGTVSISDTTASTTSTDGALVVGGGVGIGGSIRCAGTSYAVTHSNTSDRRLKTAIKRLEAAQETIRRLRPVRCGRSAVRIYFPGFLADEVGDVLPDLVQQDGDGWKSVDYVGIVPHLVRAMQETQDQLDASRAQMARMQQQIDALQAARAASWVGHDVAFLLLQLGLAPDAPDDAEAVAGYLDREWPLHALQGDGEAASRRRQLLREWFERLHSRYDVVAQLSDRYVGVQWDALRESLLPPDSGSSSGAKCPMGFGAKTTSKVVSRKAEDVKGMQMITFQGRRYDVTGSSLFQPEGGQFAHFVGHDVTYALAIQSTRVEDLDVTPTREYSFEEQLLLERYRNFFARELALIEVETEQKENGGQEEVINLHQVIDESDGMTQEVCMQRMKNVLKNASSEQVNATCARSTMTPLHKAVEKHRLDLVKVLVQAGADVKARAALYDDETPLEMAHRFHFDDIVAHLESVAVSG
ncbi:unnamed protein product [Phytophthora fragariaefolia]|uniref:Unnamed protein product n=1 Tax=Phytophthora fragariaefolia TaxID=1490495 RepID=A0A9W6U3T6_9STRA|nr:unnamed protein product [Phytophthora fragariaefolia]